MLLLLKKRTFLTIFCYFSDTLGGAEIRGEEFLTTLLIWRPKIDDFSKKPQKKYSIIYSKKPQKIAKNGIFWGFFKNPEKKPWD
mgnify:CR=1 FL=1